MGLTDSATEGTWKYSDDTLMTDSSLWMSGKFRAATVVVRGTTCKTICQNFLIVAMTKAIYVYVCLYTLINSH